MTIIHDEYDQLTGLRTRIASEDGEMRVNYSQDIGAALDYIKKLRDAPEYAKQGIKNNFQHIGHLPNAVCLQIRSEGGPDAYTCSAKELIAYLRKHRDRYQYWFATEGRV